MALTNTERQAQFRARRRAGGLKRQDVWIAAGGLAKPDNDRRSRMTKRRLYGVIKKTATLFGDDTAYTEAVYAAIAAYTEKTAARFLQYRNAEERRR
ncbi:MAG: hypothetical protein LBP76_07645 [Treponema sp.]|jgi:hypothetical protein|nr:hypothetical protein [Treponema sp.]